MGGQTTLASLLSHKGDAARVAAQVDHLTASRGVALQNKVMRDALDRIATSCEVDTLRAAIDCASSALSSADGMGQQGSSTVLYERAHSAAQNVDPLVLANALEHIAKSAAASRSQTRRIRWIEQRALIALKGQVYRDSDVDLPKSAGPATPEKLKRRISHLLAVNRDLQEALALASKLLVIEGACSSEELQRIDQALARANEASAIASAAVGQEGGAA